MTEPADQEPNPSAPLPAHHRRIGDRERYAVTERLRVAAGDGYIDLEELQERLDAAFAARTQADLVPLTRDLPEETSRTGPLEPSPAPRLPDRIGGTPTSHTAIAVMSGSDRKGAWVVPTEFNAVAVMGGVNLDLTDARLQTHEVTIRAWTIMGGIDIVVPEDMAIVVDGVGFMGGFEQNHRNVAQPPPGAPVVRVTGLALMGGVTVKRPRKKRAFLTRRPPADPARP
ncbi:MAG: DUF1707 domain-containing protein [Actinomycetota bacterium]|nr:DUF1707 domain-containing protein [Actinomycetota bacterium]